MTTFPASLEAPPAVVVQAALLPDCGASWKRHREAFHACAVFPVGDVPDGFSWTGFVAGLLA